ncbi:MAG TPA: dienelactone hydrolase family protein [Burkholderiales bacterium]|nr:dienelactone hydrolase family protein [Burkholderiales bacterium]
MRKFTRLLTAGIAIAAAVATRAGADEQGPSQEAFAPKSGKGPVAVVISGQSGPTHYRDYAAAVAALGYYTVLIDGRDILTREQDGAANLRAVIARARQAPAALPGKAAVIGFSQGGGGVLAHAVAMPELVSMAVAYYPALSWSHNIEGLARRIKLPLLVLAGERDDYRRCCLVEYMRTLETAAKAQGAPLALVVYPQAGHGFTLPGRRYRPDDTADAWRRTSEMLARYQPRAQ